MIAVMSMWSKGRPVLKNCESWEQMFLLWAWSAAMNRKFFGELHLYLTSAFKEILIDWIGIKADYITTELDDVKTPDYFNFDWWIAGKVHTYKAQQKPFLHLDYDAWFSKQPPERILKAAVVAQHEEDKGWVLHADSYPVSACLENLKMPDYYKKYYGTDGDYAYCVGCFGGNDLDFIHEYADECTKWLFSKENKKAMSRCHKWLNQRQINKGIDEVPEQYGLSCLAREKGITVECLFKDYETMGDPENRQEIGFEHLGGETKLLRGMTKALKANMLKHFPEQTSKINSFLESEEFKKLKGN